MLVGALACLALIVVSSAGAQDSAKKHSVDIPQQPLTSALLKLSVQTGVYYGYIPESDQEEAKLVGPLVGEYTIDEALNELLRSTGLTYSRISPTNIVIVRAPPPPKPPPQPPKPPRAAQRAPTATPREQSQEDRIIDEVFSQASTYRHLPAPTAAGFVLDRKAIDRTGATTIMDLVRLIPQQPFLRPDAFRSNGAQYAELRGLGPDTTLVLINGHRAFASAASFSVNAFDLNQLPLSAVERVEVQLDSISVRHGADAIGGIINIVLRDDIEHPSIEARYGTAAGGGQQRQAAISAGYTGEDARAAVILDYRDVAPLLGAERDLWSNQDYRRFGSSDLRSTFSIPGNVMAMPGTLLPGIGAPFAAIPERTAGPITQPREFLPLQFNLESLLQYFPIVTQDRRASAVASAQANLTPDVVAAADLMVVNRSIVFPSVPPLVGAVVPATNPYNSFGVPVVVTELLDGVDRTQSSVKSLLIRGAASLRGKVRSWDWELSLLRSEEDAQARLDNVVDPIRLALALANPDPQQTLNLLGPGPAASPEVLATVFAPPDIDLATDATQLMGVLSGTLFGVPAGEVSTVLGTEWAPSSECLPAKFRPCLGPNGARKPYGSIRFSAPSTARLRADLRSCTCRCSASACSSLQCVS
jgi:iron complex outermembrane receptor protein